MAAITLGIGYYYDYDYDYDYDDYDYDYCDYDYDYYYYYYYSPSVCRRCFQATKDDMDRLGPARSSFEGQLLSRLVLGHRQSVRTCQLAGRRSPRTTGNQALLQSPDTSLYRELQPARRSVLDTVAPSPTFLSARMI